VPDAGNTLSLFQNANMGVNRKPRTKECGTRSFIASLFILGTGCGCVKARAANTHTLTFRTFRWLLLSLVEGSRLSAYYDRRRPQQT
jgi:hypothetical protein